MYGFSVSPFVTKSLSYKDTFALRIQRLCSHHDYLHRMGITHYMLLASGEVHTESLLPWQEKRKQSYNTSVLYRYAPRLKQGCVRTFLIQPFDGRDYPIQTVHTIALF